MNRLNIFLLIIVLGCALSVVSSTNQQREIFKGMPEDLATIDAIFQRKWDAIVSGTQTAVSAVQQSIEDFIKSLGTLVDQSHGTLGQRLSIEAAAGRRCSHLGVDHFSAPSNSASARSIAVR